MKDVTVEVACPHHGGTITLTVPAYGEGMSWNCPSDGCDFQVYAWVTYDGGVGVQSSGPSCPLEGSPS